MESIWLDHEEPEWIQELLKSEEDLHWSEILLQIGDEPEWQAIQAHGAFGEH